ncbi:hypothetical protein C0995_014346 [Termitomyces sp. Mi166|nr:hypothetical protein C0995_014346 [Termitomyces sp. Mi166\
MVIELELPASVVALPTPASELSLQKQDEVHATWHFLFFCLPPTQEQPSQWAAPFSKGKGKAKATEEDKDEEGEAAQKLRKELEDFVVLTKVFLEQQGKSLQLFVLEGFKGKEKAKALLVDLKQTGTKQAFKLTELMDSDSNEEAEEERVCVIKKIKHKHVEEPIGMRKGKEIIESEDLADEMMVPKTPAAEPSHQTLKPMVLVPSTSKPATEGAAGKVTSVVTQETLQGKNTGNENDNDEDSNDDEDDDEGSKGDDDDSDNDDNAAMDVDSANKTE